MPRRRARVRHEGHVRRAIERVPRARGQPTRRSDVTSTTAMRPTLAQRLAALVAMLALLIAVAVVAVVALDNLGSIIAASLGLGVAVVGCWYSLSRQGVVR